MLIPGRLEQVSAWQSPHNWEGDCTMFIPNMVVEVELTVHPLTPFIPAQSL